MVTAALAMMRPRQRLPEKHRCTLIRRTSEQCLASQDQDLNSCDFSCFLTSPLRLVAFVTDLARGVSVFMCIAGWRVVAGCVLAGIKPQQP